MLSKSHLAVAILILLAPRCPILRAQEREANGARVEVIVFDISGGLLNDARIDKFLDEQGKEFASAFHDHVAVNIPFGNYKLRVSRSGFSPGERSVKVSLPTTTTVMELQVGYKGDGVPIFGDSVPISPGKITGRVVGQQFRSYAPAFVKAVGLFSDYSAESKIGPNGEFEFTDLPEGKILFLVVAGDIRAARLVERGSLPTQIDITSTSGISLSK